jgi:hypothetical protein
VRCTNDEKVCNGVCSLPMHSNQLGRFAASHLRCLAMLGSWNLHMLNCCCTCPRTRAVVFIGARDELVGAPGFASGLCPPHISFDKWTERKQPKNNSLTKRACVIRRISFPHRGPNKPDMPKARRAQVWHTAWHEYCDIFCTLHAVGKLSQACGTASRVD